MQGLTRACNVDHLVKVVLALTVYSSRNVTRGIKRGSVALEYQARSHSVLLKINDRRAVVYLQKSHIAKLLNLRGHLIGIEALALIAIKFNAKLLICLLIFSKAYINKPTPKSDIFLITILELTKFCSRFIGKRGICGNTLLLVTRNCVIYFYVKSNQCVNSAVFDFLTVTPLFVSYNKLSKLCSPVSEIVDSNTLVSRKLVKLLERMSDYSSTQMSDMEGLCNVGRGIVENDRLTITHLARSAVFFALLRNLAYYLFSKIFAVKIYIQISVYRLCALNCIQSKLGCDCLGNLYGSHSESSAELEARKCDITHFFVGRIFKHTQNCSLVKLCLIIHIFNYFRNRFCDLSFNC